MSALIAYELFVPICRLFAIHFMSFGVVSLRTMNLITYTHERLSINFDRPLVVSHPMSSRLFRFGFIVRILPSILRFKLSFLALRGQLIARNMVLILSSLLTARQQQSMLQQKLTVTAIYTDAIFSLFRYN